MRRRWIASGESWWNSSASIRIKWSRTASFQGDLDADSLDLVELIMELEDQFDMKISDEDAQKIETVGQAVDYVTSHS